MHNYKICLLIVSGFLALLIVSCSGEENVAVSNDVGAGKLTPYYTSTPTQTMIASDNVIVATNTPLPTVTPTPRVHVIESGEDLGGIAYSYGVNVSKILEYNPDIDPYLLSIGTQLIIPAPDDNPDETSSIPTPVAAMLGNADCYEDNSSGFWCFCEIVNELSFDIEGVSAAFTVRDENGEEIDKKVVTSPLKRIRAASAMPVAAYFPMQFSTAYQVSVDLITALPIEEGSQRYPADTEIVEQDINIDKTGKIASVTGKAGITSSDDQNNKVWVLGIVYNDGDKIIGLRQWVSGDVVTGEYLDFSIKVYSLGDTIDHVEVIADAYP